MKEQEGNGDEERKKRKREGGRRQTEFELKLTRNRRGDTVPGSSGSDNIRVTGDTLTAEEKVLPHGNRRGTIMAGYEKQSQYLVFSDDDERANTSQYDSQYDVEANEKLPFYPAFMEKEIRMGFIQKVFGIVGVQLLLTMLMTFLFVFDHDIPVFMAKVINQVYTLCFEDKNSAFP